jgi:hypothetical protein
MGDWRFMRISIKEIRTNYVATRLEHKFIWTYYVRRNVSYYLAWVFLRLGISANAISVSWLIIGIIASIFLATGNYLNMIVGALLIELCCILDCTDGHVARFTRRTYLGKMIDTLSGIIVMVVSMLSIGIGLSSKEALLSLSVLPISDIEIFLYIGFGTALASLIAWAVKVNWRFVALKSEASHIDLNKSLMNIDPDIGQLLKCVLLIIYSISMLPMHH